MSAQDDDRILKRLLKLLRLAPERLDAVERADKATLLDRLNSSSGVLVWSELDMRNASEIFATQHLMGALWNIVPVRSLDEPVRKSDPITTKLVYYGAIPRVMALLGSADHLFEPPATASSAATVSDPGDSKCPRLQTARRRSKPSRCVKSISCCTPCLMTRSRS